MAKKRPANSTPSPANADITAAVTCVCGVTGCGTVQATRRVKKMGPEKVKKLAELERSGKRAAAVPILFRG